MVQPAPRIRKDPVVKSSRRVGSPRAVVREMGVVVVMVGAAAMAVLQQQG